MSVMAERAQAIGQEAGTKIAAAMKDAISTAAGIAGFAVESARDLVQYMVRRGQITQDEADKLIREAEDAHSRKAPRPSAKVAPERSAPKSEATREAVRREPDKGAKAAAKRSLASAVTVRPAKPEKPEKPAAPEKTTKKATKPPAARKAASKSPASKKRR
jgi:hypothetical protein